MPLILIPPYRMSSIATAVLTAYGVDPYIDYVVYLNHFEGVNNQQIFKDAMGHSVTRTGPVITSTGGFKVGTSSAYFNNSTASLIQSKSSDFVLGTGDFTIECWATWGQPGSGTTGRGLFQLSADVQGNGYSATANNSIAVASKASGGAIEFYAGNLATSTSIVPTAWAWYHIAVVRSSGVTKLYVNGTEAASVNDTVNYTGSVLSMGAYYAPQHCLDGNLDEFRITKGIARYTANFTPTTTAFADKRSERKFKMPALTSQNVSPSFLDASTSAIAITATGKPTQGSMSPYSATGWTARFNGTTDYLRIQPVAPALNNYSSFGTQNWAVDGWFTFNDISLAADQTLWTIGQEAWGGATPYIRLVWNANGTSSGNGRLWAEEANTQLGLWNLGAQFNPVAGKPYHIAMTRYNNVISIYMNGNLFASVSYASAHQDFPTLTLGMMYYRGGNQQPLSGSISNFRIRVGEAYTGPFTAPTTAPTVTAGTKVLMAHNAGLIDGGPAYYEVKTNSAPAMVKTSPFAQDDYSAVTHGGSVYFDGVNDQLVMASSPAFNLSSGTFTISFWALPLVAPGASDNCRIFRCGTNGGADSFYIAYGNTLGLTAGVTAGGAGASSAAPAIKLNVWQHIEISVSAGSLRFFVNGRLSGSAQTIGIPASSNTGGAVLGQDVTNGVSTKFKGWISDFRITNTADHTASFSVPTAPSAVNANTKMKLNFANGNLIDSTGRTTMVPVGNVTLAGNMKSAGSYAISLDGTSYIQSMSSASATSQAAGVGPGDFGTDDFTVSFWMNSSQAATGYKAVIGTQAIAGSTTAGMWRVSTSLNSVAGLYFNYSVGNGFVDGTFSTVNLHDGRWHHVAVVRTAGSVKAYVDGVQTGNTLTVTQSLSSNWHLMVGYQAQDGNYWTGQIDDIEITRNGALYSSNFTVPNKSTHVDSFGGTWDPSWNANTLSNGNLTAAIPGNGSTRSTGHVSSGVNYVEVKWTDGSAIFGPIIGIMQAGATGYGQPKTYSIWTQDRYGHAMLLNETNPNVEIGTNLGFNQGDTLGIKINSINNLVTFYKNGVKMGNDVAIAAGDYYVFAASAGGSYPATVIANFSPATIQA